MSWLVDNRIDAAIHAAVDQGASLLGICVGHQLLFDVSHEMGTTRGLGLIRGEIVKYDGVLPGLQIGRNRVTSTGPVVAAGDDCFVNSYASTSTPHTIA